MKVEHYRTLKPSANSLRVLEVRGEVTQITGYAATFYNENDRATEFVVGNQFIERIRPGAFDAVLASSEDVRGLIEHEPTMMLGRRSAGTLALEVDTYGLRFSIPIDMTDPDHQRAVSKIRRGDIAGASFGFGKPVDKWDHSDDPAKPSVRWLESIPLREVSVTGNPAYGGTNSQVRAAEVADLEHAFHADKLEKARRQRARLVEIELDMARRAV